MGWVSSRGLQGCASVSAYPAHAPAAARALLDASAGPPASGDEMDSRRGGWTHGRGQASVCSLAVSLARSPKHSRDERGGRGRGRGDRHRPNALPPPSATTAEARALLGCLGVLQPRHGRLHPPAPAPTTAARCRRFPRLLTSKLLPVAASPHPVCHERGLIYLLVALNSRRSLFTLRAPRVPARVAPLASPSSPPGSACSHSEPLGASVEISGCWTRAHTVRHWLLCPACCSAPHRSSSRLLEGSYYNVSDFPRLRSLDVGFARGRPSAQARSGSERGGGVWEGGRKAGQENPHPITRTVSRRAPLHPAIRPLQSQCTCQYLLPPSEQSVKASLEGTASCTRACSCSSSSDALSLALLPLRQARTPFQTRLVLPRPPCAFEALRDPVSFARHSERPLATSHSPPCSPTT